MALVKLFGAVGDIAGWTETTLEGATLGEIKAATAGGDARLAEYLERRSTLVIVNCALIPHGPGRDDRAVGAQDEVAFGSPVSGG